MFPPLIYGSSTESTFVRHLEALQKIQERKNKSAQQECNITDRKNITNAEKCICFENPNKKM